MKLVFQEVRFFKFNPDYGFLFQRREFIIFRIRDKKIKFLHCRTDKKKDKNDQILGLFEFRNFAISDGAREFCELVTKFLQFSHLTRHWKDHFKSDLRSDQVHRQKNDLRSDQEDHFF
jgi:hypothetical protein